MQPTFEQAWETIYKASGWNDINAARADYNAGNWKNKALAQQYLQPGQTQATTTTTTATGDPAADSILSAAQRLQIEANKRFGEYRQNNPFKFDDILTAKTEEAKEQIDPYYNETLSDYLLGVTRKRERSTADTRDLIGELQASTKSFSEQTQLRLTEATNKAREGFADVGLFESGKRLRGEGLLEAETGMQTEEFGRRQALRQKGYETGQQRTLEDLALGQKMDVRDIERGRFTDIGTRAGQLAKEAGQSYVSGFQQTLPPELQANTGFDLLKQIGVYS